MVNKVWRMLHSPGPPWTSKTSTCAWANGFPPKFSKLIWTWHPFVGLLTSLQRTQSTLAWRFSDNHFMASKDFPSLRPPVGLWCKIKSWWKWQAGTSPCQLLSITEVWVSGLLCKDRGRRCSHRGSLRGGFGWEESVRSLRWQWVPRGQDAGRLCKAQVLEWYTCH